MAATAPQISLQQGLFSLGCLHHLTTQTVSRGVYKLALRYEILSYSTLAFAFAHVIVVSWSAISTLPFFPTNCHYSCAHGGWTVDASTRSRRPNICIKCTKAFALVMNIKQRYGKTKNSILQDNLVRIYTLNAWLPLATLETAYCSKYAGQFRKFAPVPQCAHDDIRFRKLPFFQFRIMTHLLFIYIV